MARRDAHPTSCLPQDSSKDLLSQAETKTGASKGLDLSLLGKRKTELLLGGNNSGSRAAGGSASTEHERKESASRQQEEEDEDDLDAAFEAAAASSTGHAAFPVYDHNTEEETLLIQSSATPAIDRSKFKPIGANTRHEELEEQDGKPEYKIVNGKRMRRKKKKPASELPLLTKQDEQLLPAASIELESHAPQATSRAVLQEVGLEPAAEIKKRKRRKIADGEERSPPAFRRPISAEQEVVESDERIRDVAVESSMQALAPSEAKMTTKSDTEIREPAGSIPTKASSTAGDHVDEDDEEDIFAGASEWTGLPDDEEEESKEDGTTNADTTSPVDAGIANHQAEKVAKRDWFGGLDVTDDAKETTGVLENAPTLPSERSGLLRHAKQSVNTAVSTDVNLSSANPTELEPAAVVAEGRLAGLSNSSLPSSISREMIARATEREREHKEKMRSKWPGKKRGANQGAQGEEMDERSGNGRRGPIR